MTNGKQATITYVLHKPYRQGLRSVRRALKHEGLQVPMEMDVSRIIRRYLGIAFSRCKVLCVCDPILLLEATITDASAINYFPLHVVVSERGPDTVVHLVSPHSNRDSHRNKALEPPIGKLWNCIFQTLERTGKREAVHG